ncbi:MAG: serine--tRNA ligase, partial [Chloroflexota bacterium]
MLDLNLIREKPEVVRKALRDRQMEDAPVDRVLELDARRRALLTEVEAMKAERNAVSKEIGRMKDPAERQAKIDAMRALGDRIAELDEQVRQVESDLQALVATIPNIPHPDTPYGAGEHDNRVVRQSGEIPQFNFQPIP